MFRRIKHRDTLNAHNDVLEAIFKIKKILPSECADYNLERVISSKAYGYHTNLDEGYYQYFRIKLALLPFLKFKLLSSKVAYYLVYINQMILKKLLKERKDELNLVRVDKKQKDSFKCFNNYNIFFAGTATYLRVAVLYISKSKNNNILIIPRKLLNLEVLNLIPPDKVLIFEDFITDEIYSEYINFKKECNQTFVNNKDFLKKVFYLDDENFYKLIDKGLKNVFGYLLPEAYLFCKVYENIFEIIKPKNVVGIRARKIYDRALYETANKKHIKCYALLHSNIGVGPRFINSMGHFQKLSGIFVWGERQAELIRNDKYSIVDNIYITGSPLFTSPSHNKKNNNYKNNTKTILYAASKDDLSEVSALVTFLDQQGDNVNLIIKVHPGERTEMYKKFSSIENVKIVHSSKSLESLLEFSDVCITTVSESSLQAMLYSVPVLFFIINKKWNNLIDSLYTFNNDERSICIVDSKDQLFKRLNSIIYDERYRMDLVKKQQKVLQKRVKMYDGDESPVLFIDKVLN